ncbi:hypothetical protein GJAV_G00076530 [Gymnothorax javanicus]|nr:hypothetical protein GJAV_G00076530 [Gymnothorax javanicus]
MKLECAMLVTSPLLPRVSYPHPTTVSRNTAKTVDIERELLASQLKAAFKSSGKISVATDMSTDDHKQHSYTTFSAHWIRDWKLHSQEVTTHLSFKRMPSISRSSLSKYLKTLE